MVTIVGVLIYTGDNILGRFPDMEVDRAMGARTLPIRIGLKPAAMLALLLTIAAVGIIMLLWLLGLHRSYLPTASLAGMSLILLSLAVFIDHERFGTDESIIYLRYMGQLLLYMSFIIGWGVDQLRFLSFSIWCQPSAVFYSYHTRSI
jgi:4-hydroxybenzoate polyprenyltransferase